MWTFMLRCLFCFVNPCICIYILLVLILLLQYTDKDDRAPFAIALLFFVALTYIHKLPLWPHSCATVARICPSMD